MDNYAREVRPSMPTHRVGAPRTLDLSPKTPWAEVDLKSLRWKYHTNSKIISTSTYLINLDLLRSFTAIPESLRKTDTEKRRKAKHYTKSLMFPRTSTTMSNYLSCPQSSHCLHKLEQQQQNKLGETHQKSQQLASVHHGRATLRYPPQPRHLILCITATLLGSESYLWD